MLVDDGAKWIYVNFLTAVEEVNMERALKMITTGHPLIYFHVKVNIMAEQFFIYYFLR